MNPEGEHVVFVDRRMCVKKVLPGSSLGHVVLALVLSDNLQVPCNATKIGLTKPEAKNYKTPFLVVGSF